MNELAFDVALDYARALGFINAQQKADHYAWLSRSVEDADLKERYAMLHKVYFDAADWEKRAYLLKLEKRDAA